jgi:micrococcal nuclease
VKVTRVVNGDTIDISPSVEGLSRVRLIGMDTPEVYFGTQPYGPEASAFAKQELDREEVGLELHVQKVDLNETITRPEVAPKGLKTSGMLMHYV